MSDQQHIFAEGIRFEKPHEKAPDFVKGRVSINVETFKAFCEKHKNERGWINLDMKKPKDPEKNLYFELDTWQDKPATERIDSPF